ncbi:MAG: outer membrane protein transport protein [Myxococcota bacterium]
MSLALLALAADAFAGPIDVHGFGAAAMGRGLGGVALHDGVSDTFRNPAGLQRLRGAQALVGYTWMRHQLTPPGSVRWDTNRDGRVDEDDAPLSVSADYGRADGIQIGLAKPIGGRIGLGIAASFPIDRILDISTFEPSLPTWFLYENRLRRYEASVGFGWLLLPGLRVGGSAQVLTRARYDVSATLTGQVRSAEAADDDVAELISAVTLDVHEMSLELEPNLAPIIAVQWDVGETVKPLDGLQFGATWRGEAGLPVDVSVDLQINAEIEEVGDLEATTIALLAPFSLALLDHYVPEQWSGGIAWVSPERLRVYGDVRYTRWDRLPVNVAAVSSGEVSGQLFADSAVPIADGNDFLLELAATWSGRFGAEVSLPPIGAVRTLVRGGWSFEPTPLRRVGPDVSLLDTDRTVFTGGLGVGHDGLLGLFNGPVSWDVYFQHHPLADGQVNVSYSDEFTPGAPIDGGGVPVGGRLWSAGGQWRIVY